MTAPQYALLNELLSEFSAVNAALEAAESEIKTVQLAAAEKLLPQHAEAKIKLTNLEARLRVLADEHYAELFSEANKRSHQTPFGGVKYSKSTSLEVSDEEKSMLKIKVRATEELARQSEGHPPRFTEEQLIRSREELNLEVLGEMDDATLALFDIKRVTKDNFKVVPFDMQSDKPARAKKTKLQEAA